MPPPDIEIVPSDEKCEKTKETNKPKSILTESKNEKQKTETGYDRKQDREPDFDEEFHRKYKAGELAIKPKKNPWHELMYPSISFRPINMMRTNDYPPNRDIENKKAKYDIQETQTDKPESPQPSENSQEIEEVVIDQPYIYRKNFHNDQ